MELISVVTSLISCLEEFKRSITDMKNSPSSVERMYFLSLIKKMKALLHAMPYSAENERLPINVQEAVDKTLDVGMAFLDFGQRMALGTLSGGHASLEEMERELSRLSELLDRAKECVPVRKAEHKPGATLHTPNEPPDNELLVAQPSAEEQTDPEDEVYFGVLAPKAVKPEGSFIARFAAYVADSESEVRERLAKADSGQSEFRPQPETCRWKQGTPVTVRANGEHVITERPEQSFTWNGRLEIRSFPIRIKPDVSVDRVQLGFEIFVMGAAVACLWINIELTSKPEPSEHVTVKGKPARSAFASYSSEDRADVLGRLSALVTYDKGLDVFYDWLDLVNGENWQSRLEKEILQRDILFLFWSRSARTSQWVDWEWRTALRTKGLGAIQPMPIDPPELAEPPEELKHINFCDRYLIAREAAIRITERKPKSKEPE